MVIPSHISYSSPKHGPVIFPFVPCQLDPAGPIIPASSSDPDDIGQGVAAMQLVHADKDLIFRENLGLSHDLD
ncbi:hypothetical protein PABG_11401 [Paracoccidioides brasiliensis Pb03]|nr:hypothetical protein PABG_11401 [Paracoccidioides brasiliensis Pb03]